MLSPERHQSLQKKHHDLSCMIERCESAPYADRERIRHLKRERLRIKEELEGITGVEEARQRA